MTLMWDRVLQTVGSFCVICLYAVAIVSACAGLAFAFLYAVHIIIERNIL